MVADAAVVQLMTDTGVNVPWNPVVFTFKVLVLSTWLPARVTAAAVGVAAV